MSAIATISLVVVVSGAPAAWWLLGLCAVIVAAVLTVGLAEGRYFEPLTVAAAFAALAFVVRPLYLFLNSTQLISFVPPALGTAPVKTLLRLDNSEIALFSTIKLHGPLQPALTRAIGACAVFLVVFVVAYLVPLGKRLGGALASAGRRRGRINPEAAIALSLAIGVIGQALIVYKTGGISKAANSQEQQTALRAGLVYYIMAGFAVVGMIIWAAWSPPRTRRARLWFALAVLEPCLFYVLVGSRTHLLAIVLALVVVVHYRWRRLRLGTVLTAFFVGLLLAAALLAVRQATYKQPFSRAIKSAPAYVVDPRGLLNTLTQFDTLYYATSSVGITLKYKHGGWLADAFRSYVPHFIDPHKPQSPDITFRKDIFGNTFGAGRPPTIVGDLYFDFGFAGIAVGSLVVALLARLMLGLLSDADPVGYPFRVALYGLSLFIFYELLSTNYAIAIGYVLTLIIPLLIAVLLFGRIRRWPWTRALRES